MLKDLVKLYSKKSTDVPKRLLKGKSLARSDLQKIAVMTDEVQFYEYASKSSTAK